MAIKVNDNENLDVILRLNSKNRDLDVPEDILIASYSNLVDRGRKSFGNPFSSSHKVSAGVANKAHSVVDTIQKAIDESRILITNTSLFNNFIVLKSDNGSIIATRYAGAEPTASVSGDNDEIVTVTYPSTCVPISTSVQGPSTSVDSDNRTIIFNGNGLPGNISLDTLYLPNIQKMALPISISSLPSDSIPYPLDLTSSPSVSLIGIGSTNNPSISLRFEGLSAYPNKHFLKFSW